MPKTKGISKAKKSESQKTEKSETREKGISKKTPIIVKIISVFYWITSLIFALFGIILVIFSNLIVSTINSSDMSSYMDALDPNVLSILTPGFFIGIGVFFIILCVLLSLLGRGLWKLKPWARITAIVLSIFMVIYEIYSMIIYFAFGQIIWLLIYGAIGYYLLFNEEAKKSFA